jgi:hypothetical protein
VCCRQVLFQGFRHLGMERLAGDREVRNAEAGLFRL